MAQTANTQEPTMEEILASIRRIISEDGDEQQKAPPAPQAAAAKPAAAPAAKPAAKPAPEPQIEDEDDDVLELTDIVPEEEPVPMPPPRVKPVSHDDVVMVEAPARAPAPPRAAPSRAVEEAQLISDRVRDQASSSFMQLARNVLVQETSDPRSLEHLVQEMLRPMLQAWLNEHLPSMVEGLVQQEIERVTRRERR